MNAGMLQGLLSLAATLGAAWLLTYAVHSTALIGTVWLADRAGLLRSLRLRDLAWRTALVGGLLTATLQLSAGLTPFGGSAELRAPAVPAMASELPPGAPEIEPPQVAIVARTVHAHPTSEHRTPLPEVVATPAPEAPPAPAVTALPPVPPAAVTSRSLPPPPAPARAVAVPRLSPAGLAFLGWAVVASAFLLRLAVLRARLLTTLGERSPVVDPMVRARLQGLCGDVGHTRPVRLTTAEGLRSPVALGWSEICLPAEALLELDDAQQRSVLAHELAHLRRLDPVWLVLGTVLEHLFFFQPLNRVARARMQEVAEFLCDDWAAARNGSGIDVARGLASVAAWLDGRAPGLPLAGMAEHPSQLLARVTRLLERSAEEVDRLRPWHVGGMALLLLVTVLVAPGVRASPEREARSSAQSLVAVLSPDRELLESASDDAGPSAAPAPEPAVEPRRAPEPEPSAPAPTRTAVSAPRPQGAHSVQRVMVTASPRAPVVLALATAEAMPAVAAVPAVEAIAATPPRSPVPPRPVVVVDTSVDVEQMRRDAQRMARDAERQARAAVRRAQARSKRHGRGHGDGAPADPKTVDALIGALKDADPGVRQAAAESLGRIGDPRAVDPLAGVLSDANVEVRKSAIEALGNIDDAKAIPALAKAAGDANPAVRREAAEALLSFDEPAAGEPLVKLLSDSDARVRVTALEGLSRRGDKRALGPLTKLVKDPNVEVRARAVRALARYRDPAAQEGLVSALKDENPEVRAAAAAGLGELELKAAPQGLIDATRDPSADVRQQAAETLGQIHDARAVPQLKSLLEDADSDVRSSAVEALSEIRDSTALQALITAMQSKDVTVRRAAAQALGQRN